MENIKSLSSLDRPREKLIMNGPEALTDCELFALLLGSGTREHPVMALCETLLDRYKHNLDQLAAATADDLCTVKGIGAAKATIIVAAMELGRRRQAHSIPNMCITTGQQAIELVQPYFTGAERLQYFLLLADKNNHLLATSELQLKDELPDIARIIHLVLEAGAAKFGLVRNKVSDQQEWIDAEEKILNDLNCAATMLRLTYLGRIIHGQT